MLFGRVGRVGCATLTKRDKPYGWSYEFGATNAGGTIVIYPITTSSKIIITLDEVQ